MPIASDTFSSSVLKSSVLRTNREPEPEPVYCSDMTFTEAFALNSSGAFDGMELTVTNDGGGLGNYYAASDVGWTSASGKVSVELTFDSSTDLSNGGVFIGLVHGDSTIVTALEYLPFSGRIKDVVDDSTLATVSPTIGQFTLGVTLDQATGTATYSYKLDDATEATANASLTVDGAYNNTNASFLVIGSNTPTSGVNVVTVNSGQAAFVTNVDGNGYCEYT